MIFWIFVLDSVSHSWSCGQSVNSTPNYLLPILLFIFLLFCTPVSLLAHHHLHIYHSSVNAKLLLFRPLWPIYCLPYSSTFAHTVHRFFYCVIDCTFQHLWVRLQAQNGQKQITFCWNSSVYSCSEKWRLSHVRNYQETEDLIQHCVLLQYYRAWKHFKIVLGKCCTIQVWKALRDLPIKPHRCNCCQRCFYKVLTQGCEYLCKLDISVFHFQ